MRVDTAVVDGNEAAAGVAYRTNEVVAIYPITPASPMGELADAWSVAGRENIWGAVPDVVEMQSEGGAAGAVHGALQAGALATTFTASQGLLLMLPNMFKIAGELTPFCMHVAARSIATHALSIFGDHSDVMACRQCGFALLASASVQEAHDLAAIAHAATLRARVPFLHFFDGFRTSHELQKIAVLGDDDLRALIPDDLVTACRDRALTPDRPVIRGTAQNPDTFFQAREACNAYYDACPGVVAGVMGEFAELTGRRYGLFDWFGAEDADTAIVMMGSGAETARETIEWLNERGRAKAGLLQVRLYRPFDVAAFAAALPASVQRIAVLDRTKEPGAVGEPLYLDVVAALREAGRDVPVTGGRYGLSSKELTPAMVEGVLAEAGSGSPKRHFTVGIRDDVTDLSIDYGELETLPDDVVQAVFWGLGSDGTVGANKNTIKIIGSRTEQSCQGYFVYDSKKAGAVTVSHLRFGPRPIRASYLVGAPGFVACHSFEFLDRYDVLKGIEHGGVFLLNAPGPAADVWSRLPRAVQRTVTEKELRVWAIDALAIAQEVGLGRRINTIMQAGFFALSEVLPHEVAIAEIKASIESTYGKLGGEVVRRNLAAVDAALENLHEVKPPRELAMVAAEEPDLPVPVSEFFDRVTAVMLRGEGDRLPVSAFPVDGTWPTGTSRHEKRRIASEIPIWDASICIQCNQCAFVCPHAAIRTQVYDRELLSDAPEGFASTSSRITGFEAMAYTVQVAPDDCTGCRLCVEVCPAKDKANPRHRAIDMEPVAPHREREARNFEFFLRLPPVERGRVKRLDARGSQLLEPLFEFSGACAGCGETPYVKLLTQLFGDRLLVANATGCSSIYGGNLPTTPYCTDADGRGPAWSNSLFEDNAEFGLGFRLAVDQLTATARHLLREFGTALGDGAVADLLDPAPGEAGIARCRQHVAELRALLSQAGVPAAERLLEIVDWLVPKSVWLVGGDGWAYDIGYGGLDHVLSLDRDVNVLVLDTEVYSNTGGQQSKATPLGASAKFAAAGKATPKKDLGLEVVMQGNAYVARVAFGSKINQTVQAFLEAEAFPGPSLIIAYSHCVAHGYDMRFGVEQQKLAVDCGAWPLYRFDPRRTERGEPGLVLDSGRPRARVRDYQRNEARFRMVERMDPRRYRELLAGAQSEAERRYSLYEQLAGVTLPPSDGGDGKGNGNRRT